VGELRAPTVWEESVSTVGEVRALEIYDVTKISVVIMGSAR
jgi:hypothetical protein